jgi:hypothetical protein
VRKKSCKIIQSEHYYIIGIIDTDVLAFGATRAIIKEHGDSDEMNDHGESEGGDHEVGLMELYFVEFVFAVDEVGVLVVGFLEIVLHAFNKVFGFGDEDQ